MSGRRAYRARIGAEGMTVGSGRRGRQCECHHPFLYLADSLLGLCSAPRDFGAESGAFPEAVRSSHGSPRPGSGIHARLPTAPLMPRPRCRGHVANPDIIVCDKAVSAPDVSIRAQTTNLLMDPQDALGLSLLFIGHGLLNAHRHRPQTMAVQRQINRKALYWGACASN